MSTGGTSGRTPRAGRRTPSAGRRPTPRQAAARRSAAARQKAEAPRASRRRLGGRRTRVALVIGASVVFVGFLFAVYFPTRTWLAQRRSTHAATAELQALSSANRSLRAESQALKDPAVIAKLARSQYGMVKQGEQAYVVLPPPAAPTALPKVWPFAESVTPAASNSAQGQVGTATSSTTTVAATGG